MQMALSPVKVGNHQVPSVTESEAHSPAPEADPTLHPTSLSDNLSIGNRGDRGENSMSARSSNPPNPELWSGELLHSFQTSGESQRSKHPIINF